MEPELSMSIGDCHLQLLITRSLLRRSLGETVRAAIRGGVDLLQVREKGASFRDLRRLVRELSRAVPGEARRVPILLNDEVEAARRLPVQGVHLGQSDLPVAEARRRLGAEAWIGLSTHSVVEVEAAEVLPVTHVGMGCCFPTSTKDTAVLLDLAELRRALQRSRLPLFAIGGIHAGNLPVLRSAGVTRIAVSATILQAADPEHAAAQLRQLLDDAPSSSS